MFFERHQQPQHTIKWNFRETNCYKALGTIMGECFPTARQFFYDGTNELPYSVYNSNFRRLVYNGRKVSARVCESVCFENRHDEREPRTFEDLIFRRAPAVRPSRGWHFKEGPNSLSLTCPPALRTPSLTSLR